MKVEKILEDLVKFNTIKDEQNKDIINYIENYLLKLGFKTEKKEKYLIMSIGEKQKIGFLGHTDTVEYIDGWNQNPFELTIKGDKIYGLGVCDMKGGIACFLKAVSEIDFSNREYGVKCYFTYDEEIGFRGIEDIVNSKEKMPEYMIIGEPTNNIPMTGCKGIFAVKLIANGIKVHSSNPEKGKSANTNMIKLLYDLENIYNKEIKIEKNELYEVPYTTMNVCLINGGSSISSVSERCESYVDFRITDNKHIEKIKVMLNKLCSKYDVTYDIDLEINSFYNSIDCIKEKRAASFITEASFIDAKRMILRSRTCYST